MQRTDRLVVVPWSLTRSSRYGRAFWWSVITVNRWPHGYAYQYNSLFDDFWRDGGEQPCVVARRPFGRIAIGNSDAGAYAYTDSAIDHGHRAAQDILSLR